MFLHALNLLNELRNNDVMRGFADHLIVFLCNEVNKLHTMSIHDHSIYRMSINWHFIYLPFCSEKQFWLHQ